ncbi:hypothetical protein BVG91_09390 [Serratia marcescens]|nr:hypothetical protein BVG91_09390 [Serratia marcescens]
MRGVSQVNAMIQQEISGMLVALEGVVVSVNGGFGTVKPSARRVFEDNDEPVSYPEIEGVRLMSLIWGGGKSGVSGKVSAGDGCLIIALSHGDNEAPDHKTLSSCVALCGFSSDSAYPFPDSVGVRIFHQAAQILIDEENITLDNGAEAKIELSGGEIKLVAPAGFNIKGNTAIEGDLSWTGTGTGSGGKLTVQSAEIGGSEYSGHQHHKNGAGDGDTSAPFN